MYAYWLGQFLDIARPYVQEGLRGTEWKEAAAGCGAAFVATGERAHYRTETRAHDRTETLLSAIYVVAGGILYNEGFIAKHLFIGDFCLMHIIPLSNVIVDQLTPLGDLRWNQTQNCNDVYKEAQTSIHEFRVIAFEIDSKNKKVISRLPCYSGAGRKQRLEIGYWMHPVHQERMRFVLKTLVAAGAACGLAKLASMRNPSLPLKPYLYFGAGVAVLNQISGRYLYPEIRKVADKTKNMIEDKNLKMGIPVLRGLAKAVCHIGIIAIAAEAAKRMTCQEVQFSKTWECVAYAAQTYLIPLMRQS